MFLLEFLDLVLLVDVDLDDLVGGPRLPRRDLAGRGLVLLLPLVALCRVPQGSGTAEPADLRLDLGLEDSGFILGALDREEVGLARSRRRQPVQDVADLGAPAGVDL